MGDNVTEWIAPLFSIWVRPRSTIRGVVDANPRRFVIGIGWLTGALGALLFEVEMRGVAASGAVPRWAVSTGPVTLAMSAFTLGLAGVGIIYLLGLVFGRVGWMLGGVGDVTEVLAAVAWSWIPLIMLGVVAVFGAVSAPAANSWAQAPADGNPQIPYSLVIEAALGLWALIIATQTLGEVHHLSTRRAAGTLAVGAMAIAFVGLGLFIVTTVLTIVARQVV
jgi:hypothetical protein